ncbi:hypothetical protein DRW41_07125 [Neobacillus piezotolerans]|uniref:Uncharacterized protein n=1 Tax=Neobacillus piezotolerans TaxID=2259171 RepID=A0A3D8GU83_9BACI|nr:hypothetical protein DRW41_07125 [Neobacillus piezotolerans]
MSKHRASLDTYIPEMQFRVQTSGIFGHVYPGNEVPCPNIRQLWTLIPWKRRSVSKHQASLDTYIPGMKFRVQTSGSAKKLVYCWHQ